MNDQLIFSIPGRQEYILGIKLAIGSIASAANFNIEAVEDIKIAVADACRSVTCHRYGRLPKTYEVECRIQKEKIIIMVEDKLNQRVLEKEKGKEKPCLDCPREGDLSPFIIESLMDEVEVIQEDGHCKKIVMVKYK